MILLIDNYDSFVHNLARYFRRLGQQTHVVRNDQLQAADIASIGPSAIVLSPGPRTPREAGNSLSIVQQCAQTFPILGVCLGHQIIAEAFGGRVIRSSDPMHGRASQVDHTGAGIFHGVFRPFSAGRYHSLVVDEASLPNDLQITARTTDGTIMGLSHTRLPIYGVQFHPESIMTDCGEILLVNFLRQAGLRTQYQHSPMKLAPRDQPASVMPSLVPVPY